MRQVQEMEAAEEQEKRTRQAAAKKRAQRERQEHLRQALEEVQRLQKQKKSAESLHRIFPLPTIISPVRNEVARSCGVGAPRHGLICSVWRYCGLSGDLSRCASAMLRLRRASSKSGLSSTAR